jgi:cardiolipin synthase
MLLRHSFLLCLIYVLLIGSCASLPTREAILSRWNLDSVNPQIKDASGHISLQKSEYIIKQAAGNEDDEEHLKEFIRAEQGITGCPLVAGNRVTLLVDGPTTYKAMFDAIRNAQDHIHLETYVMTDDEIGQQFADMLIERRAAGVDVKVIYDSIGSRSTSDAYFDYLRDGGVLVYKFNPVGDLLFWRDFQRDHRKLLIVDGRVAFTGGINVSGVYSKSSFSGRLRKHYRDSHWRDTEVRIEGPAVAEFQRLFLHTWAQSGQKDSRSEQDFPPLINIGHDLVRVVATVGGKNEYSIYKAYLTAISLARQRIWITQAYFAPNNEFIDALKAAARRGVDVRILLPGFSDHRMIVYASRAYYTELLEAGVKLYESKDRLLHAKTAVIDGLWSTVGSSNLDYFSFLRDNEANAVILGHDFGRQMEDLFQLDIGRAQPIELEKWRQRSGWERFKERFGSLFSYWF